MRNIICYIIFSLIGLISYCQSATFLLNEKQVKIELFDIVDTLKNEHLYQFKVTNLSKEKIYFVGSNGNMHIFSEPYADNSGLHMGFGLGLGGLNSYYSDSVGLIGLNSGENVISKSLNFTFDTDLYTLELDFEYVFENDKIDSNHMLRSDYTSKALSFYMELVETD